MIKVIKTVKSELARLKPLVDEYHRLENLLAFLEGPNTDITKVDEKVIKKKGNAGAIEIIVDSKMPEDLRNQYNLKVGDKFNSVTELSRLIGVPKATVNRWKYRDGYLKENGNFKREYVKNSAVRISEMMPDKLRIKYGLTVGDFWHTSSDMIDKLGISGSTIHFWKKNKYIEFFEF